MRDFRESANVRQDVASAVVETPAFFTRLRLCGGSERQPVRVNQPTWAG